MGNESLPEELFPPRQVEELALLVLDGSGSMGERDRDRSVPDKATAVSSAVRDLLRRLYESSRAHEIWIAVMVYDSNNPGEVRALAFRALDAGMQEEDASFWNPLMGHGDMTPVGQALEKAEELAKDFLAGQTGEVPRRVIIYLMSDGKHNEGPRPEPIAERIKADDRMRIAAIAYGEDKELDDRDGRKLLKQLASEPDERQSSYYTDAHDATALRLFLEKSITSQPPQTG